MPNLGAWLYGADDIRVLPVELPESLGPHDVRVQVKAVGICGSDVHYLKHMQCAGFVVRKPMILGHESAGTVTAVGSSVTRCQPGNRVAMEPGKACGQRLSERSESQPPPALQSELSAGGVDSAAGPTTSEVTAGVGALPSEAAAAAMPASMPAAAAAPAAEKAGGRAAGVAAASPCQLASSCRYCESGRYNLCPAMEFFATPPVHGSLANEVIIPEHLCFVLPDSVSFEEGALCEPLSVAIHACRRAAGMKPSHTLTLTPTPALAPTLTSPPATQDSTASHGHNSSAPGSTSHDTAGSKECSVTTATTSAPHPSPPPLLSGQCVAVLGAGPIGLLCAITAVAFGAASVILCDVSRERVEFSRQHFSEGGEEENGGGARVRLLQLESDSTEDADVSAVLGASAGLLDVTFDCVGIQRTLRTALRATSTGGRVVLVGMGDNDMTLPITHNICAREVDLVGIFRYCHTYETAVQLLASKKVDVKWLITHRFGFSQAEIVEGFRVSASGGSAVKVIFNL